jgi:hypothetical protein
MISLSGRLVPDPVGHDPLVLLTARPGEAFWASSGELGDDTCACATVLT